MLGVQGFRSLEYALQAFGLKSFWVKRKSEAPITEFVNIRPQSI